MNDDFKNVVNIFPSLHYIVYGSSNSQILNPEELEDELFFEKSIHSYLPKRKKPQIILLQGPRATFKTALARDFLLRGLFEKNGKDEYVPCTSHVLLIRFQDNSSYIDKREAFRTFKLSGDADSAFRQRNNYEILKNITIKKPIIENKKIILRSWIYTSEDQETNHKKLGYTELIFKSGYVLPEEFIDIFLETYNKLNLECLKVASRIVLDEVGKIGGSYPLLFKSNTAGDLFLTTFVHLIRDLKVDLLITGSTGEYEKADIVINHSKTLVDTILTTKNIDVFGDNYITLSGEGLTQPESDSTGNLVDKVPGVIIRKPENVFTIDNEKLLGLVGFDIEKIHRPGISIYLYDEQDTHAAYNKEIDILIKSAFGKDIKQSENNNRDDDNDDVAVYPINPSSTAPFHESLGLLEGKPINKTIICAVDEFFRSTQRNKDIKKSLLPIDFKKLNNKAYQIFDELDIQKLNNIRKSDYIDEKDRTLSIADIYKVPDYSTMYEVPNCYTLPYYDNVLVIAINTTDIKEEFNVFKNKINARVEGNENLVNYRLSDLKDFLEAVEKNFTNHEKNKSGSKITLVDFNPKAEETLSCLLLDTIYSSKTIPDIEKKVQDWYKDFKYYLKSLDKIELADNLKNLSDILRMSPKSIRWRDLKSIDPESSMFFNQAEKKILSTEYEECNNYEELKKTVGDKNEIIDKNVNSSDLSPNSVLYICWYSELRDMIEKNPYLGDKIKILPLPGGGFRGDWHLGILRGSVSANLGYNVLQILCNEKEDYNRFIRGVGLPTSIRFFEQKLSSLLKKENLIKLIYDPSLDETFENVSIHLPNGSVQHYNKCSENDDLLPERDLNKLKNENKNILLANQNSEENNTIIDEDNKAIDVKNKKIETLANEICRILNENKMIESYNLDVDKKNSERVKNEVKTILRKQRMSKMIWRPNETDKEERNKNEQFNTSIKKENSSVELETSDIRTDYSHIVRENQKRGEENKNIDENNTSISTANVSIESKLEELSKCYLINQSIDLYNKEIDKKNEKRKNRNSITVERNKKNREANFYAWPNSKINPIEGEPDIYWLYKIHSAAKERRTIIGYEFIRHSLSALCKVLIISDGNDEGTMNNLIINRIEGLIDRLTFKPAETVDNE